MCLLSSVLFLCVILHTMWSGKSLQLLFVKIILAVCMLVGIELCVIGKLCPVAFL